MKEKVRKVWKWFNGKKRSIGIIGLSVCSLHLTEKHISLDVLEVFKLLFTVIGGVGIAHADTKSDKSIIKKLSNNLKSKK